MNEPITQTEGPGCCRRCGVGLGKGLGESLCPACLLEGALGAGEGTSEETALIQRFGPYELLEEVGRGGMGVIYKARQPGLDRVVALKMLLAGEFADAKSRDRLLREARIAARLSHPGIVTIHEVGEHGGRPFFTMEYVPGQNLAEACRGGLLPLETAVQYVEQLARAVHYAHQHGVIHRDLKPANVLVSLAGEPKLTDFGLTKSLVENTRTLESAGTPSFMAPEQADPSLGTTGTLTDLFGLGSILYFLLTGRPPSVGGSLAETLQAAAACTPVPPRQVRPGLPPDLETITLKCLEREPARRYGSALELAEELGRWQRGEPILARPTSGAERFVKWVRRRPVVAALSAAVALSLVGGLLATSWQARRARRAAAEARDAELAARRNAYATEMTLAGQLGKNSDWSGVRVILDRTRPRPGEPDLRGWEWRYWWNLSRSEDQGRFGDGSQAVWSLATLEDGRTVAAGEEESGFALWEIATGRRLYRLPGNINQVRHPTLWGGAPVVCRLAVVPGTGLLAYTECESPTNGFVRLWDVARRETMRSLPVPGMPRQLAASPDGRQVACSLMWPDPRTLVFDVADGRLAATLVGKPPTYLAGQTLAFSADGQAVTVEDDGDHSLRVVEVATGRDRHRFPLGQPFPLAVAFSPDGRWLAVGAGFDDTRVRVWDLHRGELRAQLAASSQFSIVFDPSGKRLATGLSVWRVPEFTLEREFVGEVASFFAAAWTTDGRTLLRGHGGNQIHRWPISAPVLDRRSGRSLGDDLLWGAFLPAGGGLLVVKTNGSVQRVSPPEFHWEPLRALGTNAIAIAVAEQRSQWAVARRDGQVTLHAADTGLEIGRLPIPDVPGARPRRLYWMPHPGLLVVVTEDERLHAWDLATRAEVWGADLLPGREIAWQVPEGRLWQLQPDGKLVGYDLVRREVITRQLDYSGHHRLAFSDDGRWLLTTSPGTGGAPRCVVDTRTWKTVRVVNDSEMGAAHGGAFWPGEDRIAWSGPQVADAVTGRVLLRLSADFKFAAGTHVTPDGSILLSLGGYRAHAWWAPSWEMIRQAEEASAREVVGPAGSAMEPATAGVGGP